MPLDQTEHAASNCIYHNVQFTINLCLVDSCLHACVHCILSVGDSNLARLNSEKGLFVFTLPACQFVARSFSSEWSLFHRWPIIFVHIFSYKRKKLPLWIRNILWSISYKFPSFFPSFPFFLPSFIFLFPLHCVPFCMLFVCPGFILTYSSSYTNLVRFSFFLSLLFLNSLSYSNEDFILFSTPIIRFSFRYRIYFLASVQIKRDCYLFIFPVDSSVMLFYLHFVIYFWFSIYIFFVLFNFSLSSCLYSYFWLFISFFIFFHTVNKCSLAISTQLCSLQIIYLIITFGISYTEVQYQMYTDFAFGNPHPTIK